jgi:germination protein M
MLKKSAIRRIFISSFALLLLTIIYLIPSKTENEKPNIIYESLKDIPVYLQNQSDYVFRINIPSYKDDIEYIIELLTINGKYHAQIPKGFKAVIPQNTELIDYSIKDNIINLNFSYHLLDVQEEDEEKLIEALIYSLCEIKEINGIKIFINGSQLTELPHSHKPLPEILNYEYGINKDFFLNSLKNTEQITVYYPGSYLNTNYYIPITKITNKGTSKIEVIVNELKATPYINANIHSFLKASFELQEYEVLENSIKLTFNNEVLAGLNNNDIEEELKYALTLSIRDTYNIHDITIDIN